MLFKVKSLNEIPIINGKGEKSVSTYGNNSICMRFKTGKTTFTYTGKEIKPNFTIKYGKKLLKKDKDYSISYYNNKNIGNALAIVNGKGIYFGSISKPFYITLKTPSIKVANSGSRAIKVSWSKIPFADGYIVERSSGKKWSKVATVNGKTYFTDNKAKKGTTYKYRVQAYCKVYDNMRSYSLYSSVKTIKR